MEHPAFAERVPTNPVDGLTDFFDEKRNQLDSNKG